MSFGISATGDLVDAGTVHFLRGELQLEAPAHYARQKTAYRVLLPACCLHHCRDRRPCGGSQHRQNMRLLRLRIRRLRGGAALCGLAKQPGRRRRRLRRLGFPDGDLRFRGRRWLLC